MMWSSVSQLARFLVWTAFPIGAMASGLVLGDLAAIRVQTVHAPRSQAVWSHTGDLVVGRSGHSATLQEDGTVLVTGGDGPVPLAAAERYDPTTGRWTAVGDMTTPRTGHTATMLRDGRVLVVGGGYLHDEDPQRPEVLRSAEIFDPKSNRWSSAGNMTIARARHTATRLADSRVLILGA